VGRVDDNEPYPIGDVARRTGLSVSAIRFYSDAGVITPTAHTCAGYRLAVFGEMPDEPSPMLPPEFMRWVHADLGPPDEGFIDALRAANDAAGTSSA